MNYYVYYKLSAEQVAPARLLVNELFEAIKQRFGVQGRWMRRRDDPTTYMEVYEGVRDGAEFEAMMQRESARFGVQRRLEIFSLLETPS